MNGRSWTQGVRKQAFVEDHKQAILIKPALAEVLGLRYDRRRKRNGYNKEK